MDPEHPALRLCLCAVGQLASPLQAVWVGGCAMSHLQRVLGLPQSEPAEMLTSYRRSLFQACKDLFLDIPSVLPNMPGVEIQHIDGTTVVVHVSPPDNACAIVSR